MDGITPAVWDFELCFSFRLVLSWNGEVSAISRDAIEDARLAKSDTVIDEWDEDFDSGKVNGNDNRARRALVRAQGPARSERAETTFVLL